MLSIFVMLLGCITLFVGTRNLVALDHTSTLDLIPIVIGACVALAGLVKHFRNRASLKKSIRIIMQRGDTPIGAIGYLLFDRTGLFFNRTRYIFYSRKSFTLVGLNGRMTEIALGPDVNIRTGGAFLVITTPERTYILSEHNLWFIWLSLIAPSSLARLHMGSGIGGSDSDIRTYIKSHMSGFYILEEKFENTVRYAKLNDAQSATLNHKVATSFTAILAILFVVGSSLVKLGMSSGPKTGEDRFFMVAAWAGLFMLVYLLLLAYRARRKIEPSIDRAFRTHVDESLAAFNTGKQSERFRKLVRRDTPFRFPIGPRAATVIFAACLIATIGWVFYANKHHLDSNFRPINVEVVQNEYYNCRGSGLSRSSDCFELIDGFVADTGQPFHYVAEHSRPTWVTSSGKTVQYWVPKHLTDYTNLSRDEVRGRKPIDNGWPSVVTGLLIAATVISFLILMAALPTKKNSR